MHSNIIDNIMENNIILMIIVYVQYLPRKAHAIGVYCEGAESLQWEKHLVKHAGRRLKGQGVYCSLCWKDKLW